MRTLVMRPSAKINLMLRVGPRQADGFHDVATLLQSVALADRLTLSARPGAFVLTTRAPDVPADRTNLVWRAADALWRALGRAGEPRDVHARLDKQIPAAAGLGGGSADAAAALAGLNVLWGARKSVAELARIGAAVGSDVPFFLCGGTAVGLGRGDEVFPTDDVGRLGVVIIKPSFGIATADAYRWLDEARAAGTPAPAPVKTLDVGWPGGPIRLENHLEGPVGAHHRGIGEMVEACLRAGARGAAMTGSGSAVFGLFAESAARRAVAALQRPDWLVLLTRTLTRREARTRLGL
jgi:4-diphosphocytidyl-2-C-methyl-D-erythritol kinase